MTKTTGTIERHRIKQPAVTEAPASAAASARHPEVVSMSDDYNDGDMKMKKRKLT